MDKKHIHLNIEKQVFLKLKEDKMKMELQTGENITWEKYIEAIFSKGRN
jgi:hypothetical protein